MSEIQTLKIAKKGVFTPKIAKKWIFERGAQKIFKNEGQIRVQHEKICRNSEVPELFGNFIPTLKFLRLSSLTSMVGNGMRNWE